MLDWSPHSPGQEQLALGEKAIWKPLAVPPDLSRFGLHVGTSGFHFDDWSGRFYPPRGQGRMRGAAPGIPVRDWFPFYQLYFSFLELNHTFHREPDLAHFLELERRSKPSLLFAVKTHRDVSHKGTWDPADGRELMKRHAAAVAPLAESGRFYSFLIQLDDRLERSRRVLDYLLAAGSAAVEERLDVHVEFRNRTWHQAPVLQALQDAGIGICNADLPALPHAYPLKAYATTAKGYVRYSGRNAAAWDASAAAARRLDANNTRYDGRYDYLYSRAELEARIPGQLELVRKAGAAAVVFKNHVRAQSALNASQALALLERAYPRSAG